MSKHEKLTNNPENITEKAPMTEPMKPRECFARIYPSGAITGACSMSKTSTPSIRMIEYTAYQRAMGEISQLKEKLNKLEEKLSAYDRPMENGLAGHEALKMIQDWKGEGGK